MPESKSTILIIDDNTVIRKLASNLLSKMYSVEVAENGPRGIMRAAELRPQVILLDVMMPDMDGYEVCRRLKADPGTKDIPVIMVTSKTETIDKVMGLEIGAADYVTKPFDHTELQARVATQVKMKNLLDELGQKNALLEELIKKDGLTNLYNHRHFQERITEEYRRAVRYSQNLCCALMDIDHFKVVNDTYGHQAGDAILKQLAGIVVGAVRDTDLVARYGGEEFGLILPLTSRANALSVLERIRGHIETSCCMFAGQRISVTVSIGAAVLPEDAPSSSGEMIRFADEALYCAKESGRNRVRSYAPAP